MPKNWKEKRASDLEVSEDPKNWFYFEDPKKTHTDWYKLSTALEFANAAKKYGLDPFDFMALGMSESGLGNQDPGNPARVYWSKHPALMEALTGGADPTGRFGNLAMMVPEDQARKLSLDFAAKFLAEKFKQYPDRMTALQAYSGLGNTLYGGNPDVVEYHLGSKKAFGRPYDKIDYAKEKPQAQRVSRLAELLKAVPELMPIVFSPMMDTLQGKDKQPRQKGPGFLGKLKRPDGGYSTELSIGVPIKGKETEIPSLVPTLTPDEISYLLSASSDIYPGNMPQSIVDKAVDHAIQRMSMGLSPFAYNPIEGTGEKAVPIGQTGLVDPFMQSLSKYLGKPSR